MLRKNWLKSGVVLLLCVLLLSTTVYAGTEGGGESIDWIVVVLLAGPAFYWFVRRKYAAADVRLNYEVETECKLSNIEGSDTFVQEVKGSSESTIDNYKASTQQGSLYVSSLGSFLKKVGLENLLD